VHLGMGWFPSKKAAGFGFKVAKQSFAVSCVPKQELRHELKRGSPEAVARGQGLVASETRVTVAGSNNILSKGCDN
jgi:hypothetical protein